MSERFTRVFSLPDELYTESSPLLIAAGALLRDNLSGRILAQLKLKYLGSLPVQAVKVRLWPMDPAGRSLGEPIEYSYMDLNLRRGSEFGSKTPIAMPDPRTRLLRAEPAEVIFSDGSLWTAPEDAPCDPLPPSATPEEILGDAELCRQLRLEQGGNIRFVPARYGQLWRCACGEVNLGEPCSACGKSYFSLDIPALTEATQRRLVRIQEDREKAAAEAAEKARLEAERAAAEAAEKARLEAEQAEKRAEKKRLRKARTKKLGKIAAIAAPAALLAAALILLGIPGLSVLQANKAAKAEDYLTAVEKLEAAEKWGLFNSLFRADEKAEALRPAAHYQEGEEALEEERFLEASLAFFAAGDHADAADRALEAIRSGAQSAVDRDGVSGAVGFCQDAAARPEAELLTRPAAVATLQVFLDKGDRSSAEAFYNKLFPANSPALVADPFVQAELALRLGRAFYEANDLKAALTYTKKAEKIGLLHKEDLYEMQEENFYLIAQRYYEIGYYDDAFRYFRGDYRDAAHYRRLCRLATIRSLVQQQEYYEAVKEAKSAQVITYPAAEQEEWYSFFYETGRSLESAEEYRYAFAFYQLCPSSPNISVRMDACNEAYIAAPRRLTGAPFNHLTVLRIPDVFAVYHNGTVTFTVQYEAEVTSDWYFYYNYDTNENDGTGMIPVGEGTVTFDVPFSHLTISTLRSCRFGIFSRGASDAYVLRDFALEDLKALRYDLYGNLIS